MKKKTKKVSSKFIILVFSILICLVGVYIAIKVKGSFGNFNVEVKKVNEFNLIGNEPTVVNAYDKGVVYYANNRISMSDYQGKKIWSKVIAYIKPLVHLGKEHVYVADSDTGQINTLNLAGQIIWKYEPKYPITNIGEDDGYLIILSQNLKKESRVNIVNKDGKLTSNTMINEGTAVNVKISSKYKTYAVISLVVAGDNLNSKLETYDFSGELLSKNILENELVYDIDFLSREDIIYSSDKSAGRISGQALVWSKPYTNSTAVQIDSKKKRISVVDKKTIITLNEKGEVIGSVDTGDDYNTIINKDKFNILLKDNELCMLEGLNNIVNKYRNESKILYTNIVNKKLVIVCDNKCKVMSYRYIDKK